MQNICRHELRSDKSRSCAKCACYIDPRTGVFGLKSQKYNDPHMTSDSGIIQTLKQQSSNFVQMVPLKLNPVVNQILDQLVTKFSFGLTTYARAIYIFHHLLKERPQFQYQQLRYGTVCLFLAAKMTERQDDIPRLGKFIREACKVFEKEQYLAIQQDVFGVMFDRIFSVSFFTDFLDYYRVKGLVFSNERQHPNNIPLIESKLHEEALSYIRSGEFLSYSQQKLAALLLHTARQELRVSEIWNQAVEFYTRMNTFEVYNIVKEMRRNTQKQVKKMVLRHSISSFVSSTVTTPTSFGYSRTNSNQSTASMVSQRSPKDEVTPVAV